VGYNKGYLGNTAAARGWLARAARIVETQAPELRGELLGATANVTDDPVQSELLARQAAEIGRVNGNSHLELMAMHAVGQALVQQGRIEEGMSLLDEAMAGVVGGEGGDPLAVAQMSCMTIVVCGSCFDLERATQATSGTVGCGRRSCAPPPMSRSSVSSRSRIRITRHTCQVPSTVNVVGTIKCDGTVAFLDMWVSLFRDNTEVSYAHNRASVTDSLQANTAVACVDGTYFGGATGAVTFPPNFVPPTSNFGGAVWSPDQPITC